MRRVVVTGMGAITSLGIDKEETWEKMSRSVDGTSPITEFDVSHFPIKIAATVQYHRLDSSGIEGRWREMPKASHLYRQAARSAIEESGLLDDRTLPLDPRRTGIITGIPGNRVITTAEFTRVFPLKTRREIGEMYDSLLFYQKGHYPFGAALSATARTMGPVIHVDTACASSSHAIGEGYRLIKFDMLDAVLVGGASSFTDIWGLSVYNALNALSTHERNGSRPFDMTRNGFVMGEGSGVLVLEELERARKRGAPILAEITGYGNSLSAHRVTDADRRGYVRCMENALRDAGTRNEQVDYVSAHGTSTPQNDLMETEAIKEVLGGHAYRIPVSAVKSMIGHTICAAGAIAVITCIQMINHSTVLPTINYNEPDPDCDLDYVPNRKREDYNIETAMCNSFGFGGQNVCLVVKKYKNHPPEC